MAKEVKVSIIVDDNGTMRLTEKSAKKLGGGLDKVSKSASSADRALKGTAQISSNSTKNFSKMSQGITGGLVPAYATLAANIFALTAAFQAFKVSADVTNLIEGQKALGAVTGIAYGSITTKIRDATAGMLSFKEAASATAIGLSSGLSSGQLEGLAVAAKNSSAALGRDLTDSFNRLIRGVTKAEPELLDELGIILRLEDASKKYAEAMDITGRKLTTFEKQQAVANDVLQQANDKYGKIAEIIDPAGQAINRLGASFDELLIPLQTGLTESIAPVFNFLSENLTSFSALLSVAALSFAKSFLPAIPVMSELGGSIEDSAKSILKLGNTSSQTIKTIRSTGEWTTGRLKILEKAAKSKTSTVLNGSRQERKALLRDIRIIAAAEKTQKAEAAIGWNKYFLRITAGYARATAEAGKFFGTLKFLAAGAGKALNALPFIGLAFLAFDLGKQLYEAFFPIPEYVKKANEETDKFIETTKSLNEELEQSLRIRDRVVLSTKELVVQIGNAVKSSEALKKVRIFQDIRENADAEKVAEAYGELVKTFENLTKLDSRFGTFLDGLETLKETGQFNVTDEFSLLQSQIVEGATALERWPDTLKKIKDEFESLINVKSTNPFAALTGNIQSAVSDGAKILDELRAAKATAFNTATAGQIKGSQRKTEIAQELEELKRELEDLKTSRERILRNPKARTGRIDNEIDKNLRDQEQFSIELENMAEMQKKRNDAIDAGTKAIKQQTLENLRLQSYVDVLGKSEERRNKLLEDQRQSQISISKLTTKGVTIEDKRQNLAAKRLSAEDKVIQAKLSEIAAADQLLVVEDKKNGFTQFEIDAAERTKTLATEAVQIAERERDVKLELIGIEEIALDRVAQENEFARQNLILLNAQAAARKALAAAKSGVGEGNFGYAQVANIRTTELAVLEANKKISDEKVRQMKIKKEDLELLYDMKKVTEKQYLAAVANLNVALDKNSADREALRIFKDYEKKLTNSLFAKTEELQISTNTVGLLGKQLYIQERINKEGKGRSPEYIETLEKEAAIQYDIKATLENQKALQNTLVNSLSASIDGLIQGTMTLKDAFKNVALSILKQLSQMITQALVFKLLMGTSFGSNLLSASSSVAASVTPVGRNGGVFSGGKKMGGYADGGIASGSTSGYPAILHGTEAVVPLPDGKSIPVSMPEGGMSTNNVTVNVNMENGQTNSQSDGQQGANLGKLLAGAVKEELQRQKRPGGILSPYGAA